MIDTLFKKYILRIELRALRGYQYLKKQNRLYDIQKIKEDCSKCLIKTSVPRDKLLLGSSFKYWNILIAQFTYSKILNLYFTKLLLAAVNNGVLIYPLPGVINKLLLEKGIRVNRLMNELLWVIGGVSLYLSGVFKLFNILAHLSIRSCKLNNKNFTKNVYFHTIDKTCLPMPNSNELETIVDWYIRRQDPALVVSIYCDVKFRDFQVNSKAEIKSKKLINTLEYNFYGLTKFLIASLLLIIYNPLRSLIFRDMYYMYLFNDIIYAYAWRYSLNTSWTHIFNLSRHVLRPLWSYEAEAKGNIIEFYFYSTNTEVFSYQNQTANELSFGYDLCTWSRVFVWDLDQKNYVNRTFLKSPSEINIVGSIPLSDSVRHVDLKKNSQKFVAVFDIQPFRKSKFASLGLPTSYYDGKVAIQFNIDIDIVMKEFNIQIIRKRKREIGKTGLKAYHHQCDKLLREGNLEIFPQINAKHVIEHSAFVIAMPFTGVATQAKEMNRTVVYYDPFGGIPDSIKYSHGVATIEGIDALRNWVNIYENQFK